MDTILSYFSVYEIKARFFPALLLILPIIFTIFIWYPDLISLDSSLIIGLVFFITIFFLAKFCRAMGLKVQNKMLKEWGDFPSTTMLRHSDSTIDSITKYRYHSFLNSNVENIKLPTPEEEAENREDADLQYRSAVKWLLEYTRDTQIFNIIYTDNANYGFSRNMLGVKYLGISLTFLAIGLHVYGIHMKYQLNSLFLPLEIWLTLLFNLGMLMSWIFFVNKKWVTSNAYAFARSLLACCEPSNKQKQA